MTALVRSALLLLGVPSLAFAQTVRQLPPAADAPPAVPANDAVLVVDATGAGDFLEVSDAIAAALPRTLVLVRAGTYTAPVAIRGVGLTLQADAGAAVTLTEGLVVEDVAAGHGVVVAGMTLAGGFTIDGCEGTVRLDRCTTPPSGPIAPPPPGTTYWNWPNCGFGLSYQCVRDSEAVTIVDCEFHGADGVSMFPDGAPGHHGLQVELSTVALYHTILRGGEGYPATSTGHYPVASGAGGDGLRVRGADSVVRHCGLDAVGGLGGTHTGTGTFAVTFGCDGIAIRSHSLSTVDACVTDDLLFDVDPIVRDGELSWYTIEAPPQAPVYLMLAARSDWRTFAPASGILHLGSRAKVVPLGVMPASGTLHRPLPTAGPASILGHVRVELQVYARVQGIDRYSEPRTIVVVDPGL